MIFKNKNVICYCYCKKVEKRIIVVPFSEPSTKRGHRAKRGNFYFILYGSFIFKKVPPESQGEPIIFGGDKVTGKKD